MFTSEELLGVRAAHVVHYHVIDSRASAGGTGDAKCGGNYASSLLAKDEAAQHGADEVMFLDSETRSSIDELSGMNVFAITADDRILTPALTGSILEGVTRGSILQ